MVVEKLIERGFVKFKPSGELEWKGAAAVLVPHLGYLLESLAELPHLTRAGRRSATRDEIAAAIEACLGGSNGRRFWDKSTASRVINGEFALTVLELIAACRCRRADCFKGDDPGLLASVEEWLAPALHLQGSGGRREDAFECLEAAAVIARLVGDEMEDKDELKKVATDSARNTTMEADVVAHARITKEITKCREGDVVLGEERDWRIAGKKLEYKDKNNWVALEHGQRAWMVDAIDGTLLYLRDLPWAVSIGVGVWNEARGDLDIDCAAVYAPKTRELFLAVLGGGAVLVDFAKNRVKILKPSSIDDVGRAMVATHLSAQRANFKDKTSPFIHNELVDHSFEFERVLMWGVGSLAMCAVAAGRIECFLNVVTKYWDFCAARLIVECAGGIVTDADDKPLTVQSTSVLASANKTLHRHVARLKEKVNYIPNRL